MPAVINNTIMERMIFILSTERLKDKHPLQVAPLRS